MRTAQYAILLLLLGFLVWKGIYPAWKGIDTDFPNYYTSARLFAEGEDISKVYDNDWFQRQIHRYGMEQPGKFSPYPPATVFLMVPIAHFSPLVAFHLWTLMNIVVLAGIVLLLGSIVSKDWLWSALLVLSGGIGLSNNFRFGQAYLLLTLLIMLGWQSLKMSKPSLTGSIFGAAGVVKYFPFIFVPLFIARKEWRLLLSCCLSAFLLSLLTVGLLGVAVHRRFLSSVVLDHLSGDIQNPFSSTFQSWNSLLRRLFVYDPALNPNPTVDWPSFFPILQACIILAVIMATALACRRIGHSFGARGYDIQFALIGIAGLLLLPAGATYHYLLLILPVAILLTAGDGPWLPEQKIVLGCYVVIGFIPYGAFRQYEVAGALTLLAYPRLWMTLALFITTLRLARKQASEVSRRTITTIIADTNL